MAIHFIFNNNKVLTEPEDGDVVVNDGILMARWLQSQHDSLLLLVIYLIRISCVEDVNVTFQANEGLVNMSYFKKGKSKSDIMASGQDHSL